MNSGDQEHEQDQEQDAARPCRASRGFLIMWNAASPTQHEPDDATLRQLRSSHPA